MAVRYTCQRLVKNFESLVGVSLLSEGNLPKPEILLERGAVLVLNKPGGLLTQAPPGIDSLELRTKQFLKIREQKPGKVYLGVPHRLDRPVSGVIVVTKNVRATQRISAQIQARTVTKKYWAVVEGHVAESRGKWIDWMRKIPDEAKSELVAADAPDAKEAVLSFSVLGRSEDVSWLEIELLTGRTHQIRLQCASRGFPICGDSLYGATTEFGPETQDLRKRWIALHARRLVFDHPIDRIPISTTAELPRFWRHFKAFEREWFPEKDQD
jgi:23S rRNA pseudouridine1911/1915/1917 synthase